ncbi:hypothetical protein [Nonomuraea sp. CA-141351]|uniref:hypothetical protein n=1 Tax=Nonomuraea sp. CA-141351 TaxID=3239996 RepID=UPI003D8E8627
MRKELPSCLVGDSGTGKSHLLIALCAEAAKTLVAKLVNEPAEAADEKMHEVRLAAVNAAVVRRCRRTLRRACS